MVRNVRALLGDPDEVALRFRHQRSDHIGDREIDSSQILADLQEAIGVPPLVHEFDVGLLEIPDDIHLSIEKVGLVPSAFA